jgi:glycosyltransferase involved in cell wall biosynthesis
LATLPANFTLLQVVPDLETGGAEQSTLDVAAAVVRTGGRALVASRGGRMAERLSRSGGELLPMPVHSKNPLQILDNARKIAAIVRREGVHVIHVRSRAPAFSALWASKMTGVPMVATYHGAYPARTPIKRWYNAVMTRGALVIANSEFTRGHVLKAHAIDPGKVAAIPRGVDLARFDPTAAAARVPALLDLWGVKPKDPRLKVLLPGRLTRLKGQLVLIEALAKLRASGRTDFLALMVGDDQGRSGYRAEVEDAVATAGLAEEVRILGHCDDMPAAYLACDVAAAPSTVPETFGRTAAEAQAMGRPILASALGGMVEIVAPGETGWLVEPGRPEAWAEALKAAADAGPKRRAAMGAAGRKRVAERYSVDVMTASTLEAYARVLEARQ